jgi:hypothetical protein
MQYELQRIVQVTIKDCTQSEPDLRSLWNKIESFELDDPTAKQPFSKALAEEMDWDQDFTNMAIEEYRKFMFLSSTNPDSMVPSINIDTVWHWHLLYTKSYRRFCQKALDCDFLDHQPGTGNEGEDELFRHLYTETLRRYREFFGYAPPETIWGGQ